MKLHDPASLPEVASPSMATSEHLSLDETIQFSPRDPRRPAETHDRNLALGHELVNGRT